MELQVHKKYGLIVPIYNTLMWNARSLTALHTVCFDDYVFKKIITFLC